ncbi:MAG TPA: hypothetical protein VL049_19370 [Candidatus Dormibacteraeota bacterium]|nr:hypothetical protein [Candidatus Dormibacteraeota bacterium]
MSRKVRFLAILGGVLLAGMGTLYAAGGHPARVKLGLAATSAAPTARGKSRLTVRGSKHGKFAVVANHLGPNKTYDLVVGGVKVGVIKTSAGGSGRASFKTTPGTRDALLGFDPRGSQVLVRDEDNGDDVLVGDMPDSDPTETACCLADGQDGETECEDMTPDACTAAGGTPIGVPGGTAAASCLPDPCATTPPDGQEIVCCTNATHDDESEAECEDVSTEAECSALGGTVVQGTSCDANPCQATPPTSVAACCVSHSGDGGTSETECEGLSAEACTALGGTAPGGASCDPDPCGGGS